MKKLIFFSLFGLFFLAGCGNKPKFVSLPPIVEPVIEQPKSFETILPSDTWVYTKPEIIISEWIWTLVKWLNGDDTPEKQYKRTKVRNQYDGQEYFETTIIGYIYTYIYQDLGIKITTPSLYLPYFFEKSKNQIFKRNNNIIYLSGSKAWLSEYIQKLTKTSDISFYDQIKSKHTPKGCKIDLLTWYDYTFFPKKNNLVSIMFSDISPMWNTCIQQDIGFPQNDWFIMFFYDPEFPTTYYKISFIDWCAPGPCSIFGKIEFF